MNELIQKGAQLAGFELIYDTDSGEDFYFDRATHEQVKLTSKLLVPFINSYLQDRCMREGINVITMLNPESLFVVVTPPNGERVVFQREADEPRNIALLRALVSAWD